MALVHSPQEIPMFNKNKKIWRVAHSLKRLPLFKKYYDMTVLVKSYHIFKSKFLSKEECNRRSYLLAEQNNFQGSAEFYWTIDQRMAKFQISVADQDLLDIVSSIESHRTYFKRIAK